MAEKMSQTAAVLYTISVGKATIDECLKRHDARTSAIRREWLITVGATLDVARVEVERLTAELADARGAAASDEMVRSARAERDGLLLEVARLRAEVARLERRLAAESMVERSKVINAKIAAGEMAGEDDGGSL